MAMTIHCDIVSAEQEIFSGLAELVVANASLGDLGVSYGHAPLLTGLEPGPVRVVTQGGGEEIFYVSGGYLEIQPGTITILADTALRADDMDEAAAVEAQKQALADLADQSSEIDYTLASARLAEAAAQIRAVRALKKKMGK
jgi:F-type H+-transporting ATPase subunit epsilon